MIQFPSPGDRGNGENVQGQRPCARATARGRARRRRSPWLRLAAQREWWVVLVSWGLLFIASGCTEQTRWQRITFVPERVTEVLAVEDPVSLPGSLRISIYAIPSLNLYIRTQEGGVYRCRRSAEPPACDPIGPEQVPAVRVPQSLRYDHCDSSAEAVTKAPGPLVDTVELCGSYDPAAPLVYSKIVVLEDGGVWEWYTQPSPGALSLRICSPALVYSALLLLGVVIIVRVTAVARSARRQRHQVLPRNGRVMPADRDGEQNDERME